jgi:hypothetical protein
MSGVSNFKVKIADEWYPKRVPLYRNSSINFTCLNANNETKTILMWNKASGLPFGHFTFGVGEHFKVNNCPVTNCELTHDRAKLNSSDLVVFHVRNSIDFIPNRTFETQRFVHMVYESQVHCSKCLEYNQTVFNYSATNTPDSDFMSVYWTNSGLFWDLNETFDEHFDFRANKTKLAAALITNFVLDKTSNRFDFIKKLNKSILIDMYGGSNLPCPWNCKQFIADTYLFYLAFENSMCRGYVTEKFFDTFNYNIVPIVMGLGNYSFYIPRSAYIDVLDFESIAHLSEYLIYLSENKTAYNEYFKWKKYVKSDFFTKKHDNAFLCDMCIQLQMEATTGQIKQKSLTDMSALYETKANCLRGETKNIDVYQVRNMKNNDAVVGYLNPEEWS